MMIIKYFAYGSNMDPQRMKERGVNYISRKPAILEGWKLVFNKISSNNPNEGYANIIKDKNSKVEGCLYEVEESEIKKLDKYEGYPNHYTRTEIEVMVEGNKVFATTYKANPEKISDALKPSKEYLNHLLKGYDCFSKEYLEKLKKTETLD
ncbi:MAG: gamma-glutamylcyclotransferase [Thermodesulfobacterium geofontis]|uniref:Gamma-glutamylcyclotransferase n=1 Tax=Thermodesulfobacterium geofontis TaxID=1295609 RepID=A0A2N7QGQ2_9BACT|nr:MAG: gamma-glutamylcyclotransferase [Thermodesulfobacterium geofontis]